MKRLLAYFTKFELILWTSSVAVILTAFLIFDRVGWLSLAASLVGVTSLIFCAKGNPTGQVLIIIFAILYGIISYGCAYYGEMITYLGMSAPMAVFSLVTWIRNSISGRAEVRVGRISRIEMCLMLLLDAAVTCAFFFILRSLGTSSLLFSTISVTTSFAAAYLTMRRSPLYALAYAMNDTVLIVLWVIAVLRDPSYVSVIICFVVFLVNDLYAFVNWGRMKRRQASDATHTA